MDMTYIIIFVIVIAVIGSIIKNGKAKGRGFKYDPNDEWPYIQKDLMTKTERLFFAKLKHALPEHTIFAQVQLSRLIDVKKGHDFQQWFNRINRMSADYVVVDRDLKTVAVIELDDSTHNQKKRIEADKKKDKALTSAGINMIRWKVTQIPSDAVIRQEVLQLKNVEHAREALA